MSVGMDRENKTIEIDKIKWIKGTDNL